MNNISNNNKNTLCSYIISTLHLKGGVTLLGGCTFWGSGKEWKGVNEGKGVELR
jgi:hypothetical protein